MGELRMINPENCPFIDEPFVQYDALGNIVDEPSEIWIPVRDYEGLYLVSNYGKVRGADRYIKRSRGGLQKKKGQFLKPCESAGGYLSVSLSKEGKATRTAVHRIVAESFLPRPEGVVIDHMNKNRQDNRVFNLRYCSQRENLNNMSRPSIAGATGVSINPDNYKKRYRARIRIGDKMKNLGSYFTLEEASEAYKTAKLKLELKSTY